MKKKTQLKNNNLYQHDSLWVVVCEYMWGYVNNRCWGILEKGRGRQKARESKRERQTDRDRGRRQSLRSSSLYCSLLLVMDSYLKSWELHSKYCPFVWLESKHTKLTLKRDTGKHKHLHYKGNSKRWPESFLKEKETMKVLVEMKVRFLSPTSYNYSNKFKHT